MHEYGQWRVWHHKNNNILKKCCHSLETKIVDSRQKWVNEREWYLADFGRWRSSSSSAALSRRAFSFPCSSCNVSGAKTLESVSATWVRNTPAPARSSLPRVISAWQQKKAAFLPMFETYSTLETVFHLPVCSHKTKRKKDKMCLLNTNAPGSGQGHKVKSQSHISKLLQQKTSHTKFKVSIFYGLKVISKVAIWWETGGKTGG